MLKTIFIFRIWIPTIRTAKLNPEYVLKHVALHFMACILTMLLIFYQIILKMNSYANKLVIWKKNAIFIHIIMNWIQIIPLFVFYYLNYTNHFNLVIFVVLDPEIVKITDEIHTLRVPFRHPPFEKISNNVDFSL